MVNLIWQDRLVSLYAWYLSIGAQQSVSGTTEGNLKVTKCLALWPSCDRLCLVLVNFHSSRIPKRQTSHDDVVAMITLYKSNHSVKEISEQTGVSHNCVQNKDTSSLPKLQAMLMDDWASIAEKTLHKLADSVPKRMQACGKIKGNTTKY